MKPTLALIRLAACLGAADAGAHGLASYVAYSRVETKRHTSDVVAGAAIGVATNLVFTHPREHVAVALDGGRGHAGCSVARAW